MRSGLSGRRHPFAARPIQTDTVEIALGRVVGRGDEVDPARLLVDGQEFDHIEIAGRDQRGLFSRPVNAVDVLPAIALAEPEEFLDRR